MHILSKFLFNLLENNGATFNTFNGQMNPKQGYFVSIKQYEQIVELKDLSLATIENFVEKNKETLSNNHNYLGAWIENDKVYLDISQQFFDKHQALTIAFNQQQRAIYDAFKDEVINLPTPQKSGTFTQQQAYIKQKIDQLCN